MISFWERESFIHYDIIIVGAGITGLSTAASIKESRPDLSVLVLERGALPTGASTKNAGFACFGSLTEILEDLNTMSTEEVVQLVELRWQGLHKTRERLGDAAIDYQNNGGYELLSDSNPTLEKLNQVNDMLFPLFNKKVYRMSDEKISSFGFKRTKHLIHNHLEGQLHTGKLIQKLWQYCNHLGVMVLTGVEVNSLEETNRVEVLTNHIRFSAKQVAICTNAFTNTLIDTQKYIEPGRGLVMAIKPDNGVPFKGTFHYDGGYYYFRNYENTIIFGGGRNLDKNNEKTTEFEINEKIKSRLISDLEEIIIPDRTYQITDIWTGIMAFGDSKSPLIEKIGNHIYLGARLGGMGVAIGSQVGENLAKQMINASF